MKKHKHYQAIMAFADGWMIQVQTILGNWVDVKTPGFDTDFNYCIIPDENGWLPWYGGKCPVENNVMVDFKTRKGYESSARANELFWDNATDIIKYRIHKQEKKKVEMWQWIIQYKGCQPELTTQFWDTTDKFHPDIKVIKRADWTRIEVEVD